MDIDIDAATKLIARKPFNRSNTSVKVDDKGDAHMYLFANHIATHTHDGRWYIRNAGWNSRTTRSRLSALPNVRAGSRKNQAMLNGQAWDGQWTELIMAGPVLITSPKK
jgi:hypothetical protein